MSLRNNTIIKYKKISSRICTQTKFNIYQETSFCTCKAGSLTIEAAVIIPLAVGFLVCVLYFFRVIQVQATVEEALIYVGRMIAVESSIVSSEEALFLSAEAGIKTALKKSVVIDNYVENGVWGVSLLRSKFQGEDIVLCAEYKVRLPVKFFGIDSITLSSQNAFRKWIGDIKGEEDYVYVTSNGEVYHTNLDCPSLSLSIKQSLTSKISNCRGKDGQKYYPCSACVRRETGVVYYTDYGTLYHEVLDCSALKRTVKKIAISEIGGKRQCMFCLGL